MLSLSGNTGSRPYAQLRRAALAGRGDRADARPVLLDVLVGVVAGAHQRARGDVLEAELVGRDLERLELVRVPVAHDRQVALGRTQVLADGEHLDALLAQLAEGVDHLLVGLAEPDHQAGLRRHLVAAHLLGVAQDAQRALPARAAPGDGVEPRDDLDVVVEHVGTLGDDLRQRHLLAAEVGGEALDLAPGRLHADGADHADPDLGAVVGEVVAVDGGDHRVAEAHLRHGAGHAQRPQRRVQVSPRIMNVAVPRVQHSPTFGQAASWHTVWRFSSWIRWVSSRYFSPPGGGTLNHGGLRPRKGSNSVPRYFVTSIPPGL